MATNEILDFCQTDTGTNLLTQAQYVSDPQRPIGNQRGIARAQLVNKAMRQASTIAAGLGQFMADRQAQDVIDTRTPAEISAMMAAAVAALIPAQAPPFVAGTRLVFAQASAPAGWVQDVSDAANNRMLRMTAGAGGGVGGSADPVVMNVVPYHTHSIVTGNHNHGVYGAGAFSGTLDTGRPGDFGCLPGSASGVFTVNGGSIQNNRAQGAAGSGSYYQAGINVGDHAHNLTEAGNLGGYTDGGSSQSSWNPRYINTIICQKS